MNTIVLATETQIRFSEQMINADVLGDGLGYVKFIENFGSDERIIESARMSTDKGFLGWGSECIACRGNKGHYEPAIAHTDQWIPCSECKGQGKTVGDEKLLKYLWDNKHATPFEMGGITIEVKAPIMVFREWHRHRTQSYNEFSARYSVMPEEFYVPSPARMSIAAQAQKNKQGSGAGLPLDRQFAARDLIRESCTTAFRHYNLMLEDGVAKEVARLVLPVSTYSKMRASTDLRNWFSFLTLRDDPNAQWEIRCFAQVVAQITQAVFPRSYSLYEASRGRWQEFNEWMKDR